MRIAICDDEQMYRAIIAEQIDRWHKNKQDITIAVLCYASSEDLLEDLQRSEGFDIIFLDIQIPNEMNGLELAKQVRTLDARTAIVFITNYGEYACAGYQVNALRYICKPVRAEQIYECLDIAYGQWLYNKGENITLSSAQGRYVVEINTLLYVEVKNHVLVFHRAMNKDALEFRMTLGQLYTILPAGPLIRCHRSYLVNLLYVRQILRSSLHLADNSEIPIGKHYHEQLVAEFDKYYQGIII